MAEEKKIIIDEDWKSQVQAEKEAAQRPAAQAETPREAKPAPGDMPMPPASLELLATTLATEAMMALGQLPHPQTGQAVYQPQQAKFLIDTIGVLYDKTKGNATAEESQLLDQLLHQLRMAYVELTNMAPAAEKTPQ
jgi:Domain of unknown function (DUF1844)